MTIPYKRFVYSWNRVGSDWLYNTAMNKFGNMQILSCFEALKMYTRLRRISPAYYTYLHCISIRVFRLSMSPDCCLIISGNLIHFVQLLQVPYQGSILACLIQQKWFAIWVCLSESISLQFYFSNPLFRIFNCFVRFQPLVSCPCSKIKQFICNGRNFELILNCNSGWIEYSCRKLYFICRGVWTNGNWNRCWFLLFLPIRMNASIRAVWAGHYMFHIKLSKRGVSVTILNSYIIHGFQSLNVIQSFAERSICSHKIFWHYFVQLLLHRTSTYIIPVHFMSFDLFSRVQFPKQIRRVYFPWILVDVSLLVQWTVYFVW